MQRLHPIFNTDSYKTSHYLQYPPKTKYVSSYIESRGVDKNSLIPMDPEIVHFGLQAFLMDYLTKPITAQDIAQAKRKFGLHGVPFNEEGWTHILTEHGGYLPLEIRALPEGRVVKPGTPQVEIVNTDPACFWLTSYVETALLRAVWYPSTVATLSRECKRIISSYLDKTCEDPESQLPFKLHDFGARGVSSEESAALGGMAHLVNFMGTDTVSALMAADDFYGEDMAGFSIPASEHSTITAWGREGEKSAYENMITQFSGVDRLYACVSDSYDIYRACSDIWGRELKDKVEQSGGTLVVRPDSGDPVQVVLAVLTLLGNKFGTDTNLKGYKVLKPCVRVIQGDGVNPSSIEEILKEMERRGWSAENVAFGMGGALLQKLDRDTLKYAMKANAISYDGQTWYSVYKDPTTDTGKRSKRGRVSVLQDLNGYLYYVPTDTLEEDDQDMLEVVYRDGVIKKIFDFKQVRENAAL